MPVFRVAILIFPVVAILAGRAVVKALLLPITALRQLHRSRAARV